MRQTEEKSDNTTGFIDDLSPYEALRQEVAHSKDITKLSQAPVTPGKPSALVNDDVTMTLRSSPFFPVNEASAVRPSTARKRTDPLLHRVLDRNYRVQATPMTGNRYDLPRNDKEPESKATAAATPATSRRNRFIDSTLSSSPEIAAPELHAEIFSSPMRKQRTPGVSVLTPGKRRDNSKTPGMWDSDDEVEDEDFGQSPPKTIQFHVPQSRLLKTPGK